MRKKEILFHAKDLALFWNIDNKNTLYTVLKRYTKQKLIYRVFKGLYSLYPLEKIDPYLLGSKILNSFNYVSTETILFRDGIVNQPPRYITFVSGQTKTFKAVGNYFHSRSMQACFLFQDESLTEKNGVLFASKERAAADLLYYNPKFYFDSPNLLNWEKIKVLQGRIGYA